MAYYTKLNSPDTARKYLYKALSFNHENISALLSMGNLHLNELNCDSAIYFYSRCVLSQRKERLEFISTYGPQINWCFYKTKNYSGWVNYCRNQLVLKEHDYSQLGALYYIYNYKFKDSLQAEKLKREYLDTLKQISKVLEVTTQFLIRDKDYQSAIQLYYVILNSDSSNERALLKISNLFFDRLHMPDSSIKYLSQIKIDEASTNNCEIFRKLARSYIEIGQNDKAEVYLNKALQTSNENKFIYFDYAGISCRLNKKREALDYLKKSYQMGYRAKNIKDDPDFTCLKNDPEFLNIIIMK